MGREQKQNAYWIPIAIVIILISLIIVYNQSKQNMDVYQGSGATGEITESTTESIILNTEKSEVLNFTYGIPDGWTKVNKDGHLLYVHSPSSSSMEIIVSNYAPSVLSVSETSVKEQCQKDGCDFISLQWSSNAQYTIIYQKVVNGKTTFYIEVVSFDKLHIVHTIYSLQETYYDQMINTITAMIDAVKWTKEDPYPLNMTLTYSEYGNFEFAHPSGWNTGFQNNTYLAQDPKTKTIMSVNVTQSTVTYETLDKYDYIKWASPGRNSFNCQNFEIDQSHIYAMSTYTTSGTPMVLVQYMVATGTYEYIMTFDIPQSEYSNFSTTLSSLLRLFKTYENGG